MNTILEEWEPIEAKARRNGRNDREIMEVKSVFYAGAGTLINMSGKLSADIRNKVITVDAANVIMRGLRDEVHAYFKQLEIDYPGEKS